MNDRPLPSSSKSELRRILRARLKDLSPEYRAESSQAICTSLERQDVWHRTRVVLFYHALPTEPDLASLLPKALVAGKAVALPQFDVVSQCYRAALVADLQGDLCAGRYGIPEPAKHCATIPLNQLDFVLVPGLAFDLRGRRLGRGRGFYDRLLAEVRALKCGVGFDEQLQPEIPVESHDVLLDCVITPSRWLDLRPERARNDSVG